jgi:hypothetical protein
MLLMLHCDCAVQTMCVLNDTVAELERLVYAAFDE